MNLLKIRTSLSLVSVLLLSACLLGGGETRYRLIAPQLDVPAGATTAAAETTLSVARPQADRTRDSSRILVRRDRTLLPWQGAAWIDRSPELLQALLVEYLDGRVATVGRYGDLPPAFRLDLVLRRFEFVEGSAGLEAEILLVARLFDGQGRLKGSTTLDRREDVGGDSLDQAVGAMEVAMSALFADLDAWLRPRLEEAAADQ